jgi:hypothetical protein
VGLRRRGVGLRGDRRDRGALRGDELRFDRHVRPGDRSASAWSS